MSLSRDCRLRTARLALSLIAVLLSGCVYFSKHTPRGACLNDLGSPVRNFCVVAPDILWRGERPTRADARWLLTHGVGTVVSLELNVLRAFEAARIPPGTARKVSYFQVRDFSAIQVVTHAHLDEHVALVLAIIKESPKPVFINCRAGVDRTGLMAAAYRVLIEGVSRRQAIAEMERFRSPWNPFNARYIRNLTGTRRTQILRRVMQWEDKGRLRPSGQFDCRGGSCEFHQLRAEINVTSTTAQKPDARAGAHGASH